MTPEKPLPLPQAYQDVESYVEALLHFVTTSKMLQTLCGGLHILDFMTSTPDHYESVLPGDWRQWLQSVNIFHFHDLLMREDVSSLKSAEPGTSWRGYSLPPQTLLDYILSIRRLLLNRSFTPTSATELLSLSRQISVGMKVKKAHEVVNFASFVNDLSYGTNSHISHLVDLGCGQAYLARVLAGPLYKKQVVAVELKSHNIEGAKNMDVGAKLREKPVVLRNKKRFRATGVDGTTETHIVAAEPLAVTCEKSVGRDSSPTKDITMRNALPLEKCGSIQYVEHQIVDGNLEHVIAQIEGDTQNSPTSPTNADRSRDDKATLDQNHGLLVISLHSCGNLVHHGLRSLILNPSVKAVALVGCCYNLCTERLGPPTFKLPALRSFNQRLKSVSLAYDPHGFPMSERFATYKHDDGEGIRLNITARMMAVQAPQNWTENDCDSFFTRHFWRALLQRIFLDLGFVEPPRPGDAGSQGDYTGGGTPIVIGSLRKSCYTSFVAYVRGAFDRLLETSERGEELKSRMDGLDDAAIAAYEQRFMHKKHELCIVWSLMAFSAGVVECAIVVDRWQFLREQKEVKDAWVQTVFEYEQSPRNLVVVGLK